MKVEIQPTQDPEKLKQNLEKRVKEVSIKGEKVVAQVKKGESEFLEYTPGIEEYKLDGETTEGLKGRPVQEEAYAKLESKKDVAKAVVATIQGYDLRILNTERQWDLKILRRFNPDIKHFKMDEPKELLQIDKTLEEDGDRQQIEIEMSDEEVKLVYNFARFEENDEA